MDQPRPTMSAFTFFLKNALLQYKKDDPSPRLNCGAFTRKCAAQWKALTERQKARFRGLAAKDKVRYENELHKLHHPSVLLVVTPIRHPASSPPSPVIPKKIPPRKHRETGKPRGIMTAYSFFLHHCRELRSESDFGDFSRKCARKWHGMDGRERRMFHQLAMKDKVRYDKEMKEYRQRDEQRSPVPSP